MVAAVRLRSAALWPGVVALSLAACAAPTGDEDAAPSASAAQALVGGPGQAACPATMTYFVVAPSTAGAAPACPVVPGAGGAWQHGGGPPRTCFSKADASQTSVLCAYAWSSAISAPPDVSALSALAGVSIAPAGGGDGLSCDDSSSLPYVSLLDDVGVTCPPPPGGPGINGPKGCDVCGLHLHAEVVGDILYLPSSTTEHTVGVTLSNGTKQIVTLAPTPPRGPLVEVALPTPPSGVAYERGPVLGYAYDAPAR